MSGNVSEVADLVFVPAADSGVEPQRWEVGPRTQRISTLVDIGFNTWTVKVR